MFPRIPFPLWYTHGIHMVFVIFRSKATPPPLWQLARAPGAVADCSHGGWSAGSHAWPETAAGSAAIPAHIWSPSVSPNPGADAGAAPWSRSPALSTGQLYHRGWRQWETDKAFNLCSLVLVCLPEFQCVFVLSHFTSAFLSYCPSADFWQFRIYHQMKW